MRQVEENLHHGSFPPDREARENGLVTAQETGHLAVFREDYRAFHQGPGQSALEPRRRGLRAYGKVVGVPAQGGPPTETCWRLYIAHTPHYSYM